MTPADLQSFRERLRMSQAQFARLVGLDGSDSGRTVRRWEAGDRSIPGTVVAIAALIDGCPDALPLLKRRAGVD